MKLALNVLFIVVLVLTFLIPQNAQASHGMCGPCDCNPDGRYHLNMNPVDRISLSCYNVHNGGQQGSCSDIRTGSTVIMDATPKDASGSPTNSNNGPVTSCTGPFVVNRQCFNPRGEVTGPGVITCTITLDGKSATTTFGVGVNPSGGPMPSTSRVPGDQSENDTLCAYTSGTQSICVDGTEGFTAVSQCTPIQICRDKGPCRIVERSACVAPAPSTKTLTVKQTPPDDLGQIIKKIFDFSLSIVGIAVFVMAVYGGFLMLLAGASPSLHSTGRQHILNAFLGALLLFAAYVILNTINPDFVEQRGVLPSITVATPRTTTRAPSPTLPISPTPSATPN